MDVKPMPGAPCYQHDSYDPNCSDCYHPATEAELLAQTEFLKAHADAADYTEAMEVEDAGRTTAKR